MAEGAVTIRALQQMKRDGRQIKGAALAKPA
jgi:hypothetical protein